MFEEIITSMHSNWSRVGSTYINQVNRVVAMFVWFALRLRAQRSDSSYHQRTS